MALAGAIAEQIDDERCDMEKVKAAQEDWGPVCEASVILHASSADRVELIATEVYYLDQFLRSEPSRARLAGIANTLIGRNVMWRDEFETLLRSEPDVRPDNASHERPGRAEESSATDDDETPMFDTDDPFDW